MKFICVLTSAVAFIRVHFFLRETSDCASDSLIVDVTAAAATTAVVAAATVRALAKPGFV